MDFQQVCPESPLWAFHKESIAEAGGSAGGGVPGGG
jgi:hypothetical protein